MVTTGFDAFDQWCLRRLCNVHCTDYVTNDKIRHRTSQGLLNSAITRRDLGLFGHDSRLDRRHITSSPCQDTARLETSEGQTMLNMGLHDRERPLPPQLRNFHCPEEGGRQNILKEDHSFGDAPLVEEYADKKKKCY